jgi:serine/threonine protein kinase
MTGRVLYVGPEDDPDRIRLGPAVAAGTEGVVYRGWVGEDDRAVAVKMLQPSHLRRLDDWAVRWRAQVELLRDLEIPGLVTVVDGFTGPLPHSATAAGPRATSLYLVMDWVDGEPLDRWARRAGDLDPEQLLSLLVPVAAALDQLHNPTPGTRPPVLHRDVKPANILVTDDGAVLVDIGSARALRGERRAGAAGTPGYIAPEVHRDGHWSAAADRYSLGCVAFFLLAGREPTAGATTPEMRRMLATSRLDGRPELIDRVMAMLDPDPGRRPAPLANWVAQLRGSSLQLPLPQRLPPVAPRRPAPPAPRRLALVGHLRRHRFRLAVVALTVVLAGRALSMASGMVDSTGSPPPDSKAPVPPRPRSGSVAASAPEDPSPDRAATEAHGEQDAAVTPPIATTVPRPRDRPGSGPATEPGGQDERSVTTTAATTAGPPAPDPVVTRRPAPTAMPGIRLTAEVGSTVPVLREPGDPDHEALATIGPGHTSLVACRAPSASATGTWYYRLIDPYPGSWAPASRYEPADDPYDPRVARC